MSDESAARDVPDGDEPDHHPADEPVDAEIGRIIEDILTRRLDLARPDQLDQARTLHPEWLDPDSGLVDYILEIQQTLNEILADIKQLNLDLRRPAHFEQVRPRLQQFRELAPMLFAHLLKESEIDFDFTQPEEIAKGEG